MINDKTAPTRAFQFSIPAALHDASSLTNAAIQIGALASKLAQEERTIVSKPGGRPENVSEHSHMLALVAEALAEEYFPELNSNKVASYAIVHDVVEAYVGDTPTHIISASDLQKKHHGEQEGLAQLKKEYAHLPKLIARIENYETQRDAESRFVRMVDKLMPQLIHIYDDGSCLKDAGYGPDNLRRNAEERTAEWLREYPDMVKLIESRNELTAIVSHIVAPHFKNKQ